MPPILSLYYVFSSFSPHIRRYGFYEFCNNSSLIHTTTNFEASVGNCYLDDKPTKTSQLAFQKFVFTKTVTTNAQTKGKHQSLRSIYHHILSIIFILWSNIGLSGGGYIKLT